MKIALGSDKSGFSLKEAIKADLIEQGYSVDDLGTTSLEEVHPFYQVASDIAPLVQNGTYDRAILICGTGAGMNIVANKYEDVHAVVAEGIYTAKMARAINNAQILCMGGWVVAPEMGIQMARVFLQTDFLQDLEEWRKGWLTNAAAKVKELEEDIYNK